MDLWAEERKNTDFAETKKKRVTNAQMPKQMELVYREGGMDEETDPQRKVMD